MPNLLSNILNFKFISNCSVTFEINEILDSASVDIDNKNPEKIKISQTMTPDTYILQADADSQINKDFFKNIKDNGISGIFNNFMEVVSKMEDFGSRRVIVTLNIPSKFLSIDITAPNLKLKINHSSIDDIRIDSKNLHFSSLKNTKSNFMKIKSTNADIDFVAGDNLKTVFIDSKNCDVTIHRLEDYQGIIEVKGKRTSISGNYSGNPKMGVIECDMKNGDVKII